MFETSHLNRIVWHTSATQAQKYYRTSSSRTAWWHSIITVHMEPALRAEASCRAWRKCRLYLRHTCIRRGKVVGFPWSARHLWHAPRSLYLLCIRLFEQSPVGSQQALVKAFTTCMLSKSKLQTDEQSSIERCEQKQRLINHCRAISYPLRTIR